MDQPTYSFRSSIFSKELTARLAAAEFQLSRGGESWLLAFADIRRIRLFAGPVGTGQDASFCYIFPRHGRSLKLRSCSIAGLGKYEDRSAQFRPFVTTLISRVAAANSQVEFYSGPSMLMWTSYLVIVVLAVAVVALGIVAALAGALPPQSFFTFVILVFLIPTLWRVVRRGRPRRFDPLKLDDRLVTGGR